MRCYLWKKWGFILFLVAVLVIGYAAIPLPGNEIFPFYSWTMFSLVPAEQNGFAVFILEEGGNVLNPPLEFQQAGSRVGGQNSVVAYRDIQNMGKAYLAGDTQRFEELRQLFEKNYIHVGTRYQLMKMNYDPITRWKTGNRTLEPLQEWTRTE